MEKSLEDLEREVTCAVCQEHYHQPRVLPCLHYYCEECILKVSLRKGTGVSFTCPECRKESLHPEGGVAEFPIAFFVNRLKAMYYEMERAHGKKATSKCEVCSDPEAVAQGFCRQCSVLLCSACIQSHQRLKKMFDGHEVVSIGELKEREKPHPKDSSSSSSSSLMCKTHKKTLVAYCFDCNGLVCQSCTSSKHKEHKFDSIPMAAPKIKNQILSQLDPLRKTVKNLSNGVKEIDSNELELESHLHSMTSTIKISFQELHDILESREKQLLADINERVKLKMSKLSNQKTSLKSNMSSVQNVLESVEQYTKEPDKKFLLHIGDLKQQLQGPECISESTIEPVEEIDIMVKINCKESLKRLCLKQAKIVQLPVNVTMEEIKSEIFVDQPVSLGIKTTKLSTDKPNTRSLQLSAKLRSLHNNYISECTVESVSSCYYRIHFTPAVRGRNEIIVSIEDQQVRGSPLSLFVSVSPLTFKKPVSSWKKMKQPSDVLMNTSGEVIVTEFAGDILIFDQMGNRLRSIERTRHDSQKLNGAAVDKDGNIFFVGPITNKLFKYEVQSRKVVSKTVERENVSGHRSVDVFGDEVMVSEQSNKSTVSIYDRDLNFKRQIVATEDYGSFIDVTAGPNGNIYVTSWANPNVLVFKSSGEFSHSFGHKKKGTDECLSPRYVCVTEKYIYVTDNNHGDISVFSGEGSYLSSFGHGYFIIPHGICVDQDGFVYVCDFSSSKVLIF